MIKQGRFLIWMILCAVGSSLLAQDPYAIHLDQSNGLPSNAVYSILQDKKGFIWLTCDKGLFRYDGSEYKHYAPPEQLSKPGSYLHEDRLGRIWYANFDGNIFYTENNILKKFPADRFYQHEYFMFDDYLWVNNDKNMLCQYDISNGKKIKSLDLKLVSIFQTEDVFYGKDIKNITYVFDQNGQVIKTFEDQKDFIIERIIKQNSDYYIIFLQNGVKYIGKDNRNAMPQILYTMSSKSLINCISIFEDQILIGTRTGLLKYKGQGNAPESINSQNIVSCITRDRNHCLWAGTINNGIFIYPQLQLQYAFPIPSSSCYVKNINNRIFLYDAKGALRLFDEPTGSFEMLCQLANFNTIYDVVPRTQEYVNIVENQRSSNGNFKIASSKAGTFNLLFGGLKKICMLDHKYLAHASTGAAGIAKANNSKEPSIWDNLYNYYKGKLVSPATSWTDECVVITGKRFKSIAYEQNGNLVYFLSNDGIYGFKPDAMYPFKVMLNNGEVFADEILNHNGNTIALLNAGKLVSIEKDHATYLSKINNLDKFLKIKLTGDHFILLGTHKIYRIATDKINSATKESDFEVLNLNINPNEVNDITYKDGYYFITTVSSFIKFKYQQNNSNNNIPFYIGGIEASGKLYENFTGIKIPSGFNDIRLSFSILNYLNSPLNIYYKINSDQWKQLSPSERHLAFASLSPGSYVISFRINGKEYANAASFTILKPFYLQLWFILLLLFISGAMVYFIYRNRLKTHQRQNRLLLEKATLEKNLRQSMLSSIKSQMNPHFLFNALNTIQSFIITEDKKNASVYLSKFSKLTRNILNMSERDTITLQEELDSLLLYLELEKMRFNEINYSVVIESNIQVNRILIPSMIIQPYVENSIKHGLLHKMGDKNLLIHISKSLRELIIVIEDNGIGRARSRLINQTKKEKHQSFASDANLKRIEILNQEKNKIGLEYEDKFDEEQNPKGTKLTIHIPLLEQP